MQKFFLLLLSSALLFICSCTPKVLIQKSLRIDVPDVPMIQVEADEDTAWWGPVRSRIKEEILAGLKEELAGYPVVLVDKNPDIRLVVKDIHTSGWMEDSQIEEVTVVAKARQGELFRAVYRQKHFKLPDDYHRFWKYPKDINQISKILTQRIIRELGADW